MRQEMDIFFEFGRGGLMSCHGDKKQIEVGLLLHSKRSDLFFELEVRAVSLGEDPIEIGVGFHPTKTNN